MAEVNLKVQLETLVQLQAIDSQIYGLKAEREQKPQELKALQASFEEKKQKLAALEASSLDVQKQKKDKELELGSREETTKKLQSQLYALKTNKEYQTMLQQISDSKADASVIEDKILTLFDQIDRVKTEIEQEKARLSAEEKIFNEQKKLVDDRIKEIEQTLSQLDAQRQRLIPTIDQDVLAQYERILVNRAGLAIVGIKDNSCMGCNMLTPHQVINLVKMYEGIITCDVCNRILYIPE